MNTPNMKKLSSHLKTLLHSPTTNLGFTMSEWWENEMEDYSGIVCNTVGCLAGHATYLALQDENFHTTTNRPIAYIARDWLELTDKESAALFLPLANIDKISLSDAIIALDRMMTGQKPWEAVGECYES